MRYGDESRENRVMNSMAVDLNTLGAFMKGRIIRNEDESLVFIIHRQSLLHQKTKLIK